MVADVEVETPTSFVDDLVQTAARVLDRSGDSDLVFLVRSPESIFDLMSGLFAETAASSRIALLPLSLRHRASLRAPDVAAFRAYLHGAALDPQQIASRPRPVAFVDLAYGGTTFETLIRLLNEWADGFVDWRSVVRKLRIVGITIEGKTTPKTWRWWQHSDDVAALLRPSNVKNVSAPLRLWGYLGNTQPKTANSFGADAWREADVALPRRDESARTALAIAVWLYEYGRSRGARAAFVQELADVGALRHRWLRSFAAELKRKS